MCLFVRPVQEGDDLTPGTGCLGVEARADHAFFKSSFDCTFVIGPRLHREGRQGVGLGLPRRPPQEGEDLAVGVGLVRRKGGDAGALGDDRVHRVQIIGIGFYIRETGKDRERTI